MIDVGGGYWDIPAVDEFQIINRHYKVLIFNENPTIIMSVIFFKFIKAELVIRRKWVFHFLNDPLSILRYLNLRKSF